MVWESAKSEYTHSGRKFLTHTTVMIEHLAASVCVCRVFLSWDATCVVGLKEQSQERSVKVFHQILLVWECDEWICKENMTTAFKLSLSFTLVIYIVLHRNETDADSSSEEEYVWIPGTCGKTGTDSLRMNSVFVCVSVWMFQSIHITVVANLCFTKLVF